MAAKVQILRWTGPASSPTKTDITNGVTVISTSDVPNPGSATPIQMPMKPGDVRRSFWMTVRLHATQGPSGRIDNIKFFADGLNNFGPGVSLVAAPANSYVQARGVEGEDGVELSMTNHSGLAMDPQDVFSWTADNPLSLSGSLNSGQTGDFGQFVVMQMSVEYSPILETGETPAEMFIFMWDET